MKSVAAVVVPRWVHYWAVLTACAAFPLVLLGAEVTTKQVGMVDQVGFRAPWHLLRQSMAERGLGYFIEHGHRLAGFVVGTCAIVLAVAMALTVRHRRLRWLGFGALFMVSAQGLLGIFRVNLNAWLGPDLALVHGLFAQLVLAVLVAAAVTTSPSWWRAPAPSDAVARLRPLALGLMVLVYLQILFGAVIRHFQDRLAQRVHVLFAFVVAGAVLWLARSLWERSPERRGLVRVSWLLAGLLAVQIGLGVEAWLRRFGAGLPPDALRPSWTRDLVRSGHFVTGALLFGTSVVLNLLMYRPALAVFAPPSAAALTPAPGLAVPATALAAAPTEIRV